MQTMVTLLARLADRGFIRAEKGTGRERLFCPAISCDECLRMETESFVAHYHKKSISSLVASLAADRLTEEDLDELSTFISRARKENEGR